MLVFNGSSSPYSSSPYMCCCGEMALDFFGSKLENCKSHFVKHVQIRTAEISGILKQDIYSLISQWGNLDCCQQLCAHTSTLRHTVNCFVKFWSSTLNLNNSTLTLLLFCKTKYFLYDVRIQVSSM